MQEERDDDSQGGNSDDEIAELRIQALLSKRVNEAEVSPAHDPPQEKHLNVNKPLPIGRPQSFRPAQPNVWFISVLCSVCGSPEPLAPGHAVLCF
ncbi:hypothetical protein E2C01_075318 [Portunus trituberculatus]|uniref:Uncharacterized protein n=1 Tax=Portunus trituberculatus TaxID=210409 RepID=A0A5B7I889_PORTR|nr:hypothetical protein [Portunus trituberculatus]